MKKKYSLFALIAVIIAALPALAGCDMCGVSDAPIDGRLPWDMPTLYEKTELTVEKYLMKAEGDKYVKDRLLASGKTQFVLESGDVSGRLKLSAESTLVYTDDEANGVDKNMSDSMKSTVVFSKSKLSPIRSEKTVTSQKRAGAEDLSYTVTADYETGKASFVWTNRGQNPEERDIKASGQVFDNEQLFFAVRAFSSIEPGATQSFKLFNAFQAFVYGDSVYTMNMRVESELKEFFLPSYSSDNLYGMTKTEDGKIKTDALEVKMQISSEKSGPALTAYYSATPFEIDSNISARKVLVGICETSYGKALSSRIDTFYTLSGYGAKK